MKTKKVYLYGNTIMTPQQGKVISYMAQFGWISPLDAFRDLGITKLATRISELKRKGVPICSEWVTVTNRYGEQNKVKHYRLE